MQTILHAYIKVNFPNSFVTLNVHDYMQETHCYKLATRYKDVSEHNRDCIQWAQLVPMSKVEGSWTWLSGLCNNTCLHVHVS